MTVKGEVEKCGRKYCDPFPCKIPAVAWNKLGKQEIL